MSEAQPTRFGVYIRTLRKRHDETQAQVAEATGLPAVSVSYLERTDNPKDIWPGAIEALAEHFDADLDLLYALADRVPPDLVEQLRGDYDAIVTARKALDHD